MDVLTPPILYIHWPLCAGLREEKFRKQQAWFKLRGGSDQDNLLTLHMPGDAVPVETWEADIMSFGVGIDEVKQARCSAGSQSSRMYDTSMFARLSKVIRSAKPDYWFVDTSTLGCVNQCVSQTQWFHFHTSSSSDTRNALQGSKGPIPHCHAKRRNTAIPKPNSYKSLPHAVGCNVKLLKLISCRLSGKGVIWPHSAITSVIRQ